MNKYFTLLLFLCGIWCHSQQLSFGYDNAGNQKSRSLCIIGCIGKKSDVKPKEIEALVPDDLQKFFPEDDISYYPNPVREELYLKWELVDGNHVKVLQVYNFNGQLLRSYSQSDQNNSQTIPFQIYPVGAYLIVLEYSSGDQKTIKIIKQ
ncbi:T9SS type A sorting domain-containing protein [Flavobacterium sp. N3904]|uniref:T9SS type A sorting domain-containing protein n=1 Tax=Flavobacterium sp. N3904 TaxID=2986835 RepID=UPI0022242836|nr:T9SS type A sorting domain-containing protein [Flavobacterium sp. N3904]